MSDGTAEPQTGAGIPVATNEGLDCPSGCFAALFYSRFSSFGVMFLLGLRKGGESLDFGIRR